jgi:hypothetical protein
VESVFFSWSFLLEQPFGIDWFVKAPNLFLFGPGEAKDPSVTQTNTLAFACLSFCIAYVVIIYRMAVRLNISEYSSLENFFDVIHLTSCLVLSTARSVWFRLLGANDAVIAAFAIAAGLRPDFYLGTVGRAVDLFLTRSGSPFANLRDAARPRVPAENMAPDAALEMVDGISDDISDRLKRIDIGTCHRLAFNNPFVIWVRTSFNILEITDWVSQALLAISFPAQAAALRTINVRTIVDLMSRIEGGSKAVADALGVDMEEAQRILLTLRSLSQVMEIRELSEALLVHAEHRSRE